MEGDYSDDDEINPEDDDVIRELFEDIPEINDEEEGEDLYGSDFEKDYQFDPTEDFYDEKDIDPNVYFHQINSTIKITQTTNHTTNRLIYYPL